MRARFRVLMLALLVTLAAYVTVYTEAAYQIANRWASKDGTDWWTVMGMNADPTFFPWPRGPIGLHYPFLTAMKPIDKFIYLYLLQIPSLIFICILLWAFVAHYTRTLLLAYRTTKNTKKRKD